jgi:hypothetical protein
MERGGRPRSHVTKRMRRDDELPAGQAAVATKIPTGVKSVREMLNEISRNGGSDRTVQSLP